MGNFLRKFLILIAVCLVSSFSRQGNCFLVDNVKNLQNQLGGLSQSLSGLTATLGQVKNGLGPSKKIVLAPKPVFPLSERRQGTFEEIVFDPSDHYGFDTKELKVTKKFERYKNIFEKLKTWDKPRAEFNPLTFPYQQMVKWAPQDLTPYDITVFPSLIQHAQKVADIFNNYRDRCLKKGGKYSTIPFSWCVCPEAPIISRFFLILCQLNDIVGSFNPSEKIVHTAFAEGALLQTWFLVNALIVLGYRNLHVNIIGMHMATAYAREIIENITDEEKKKNYSKTSSNEDVARFFHSYLPDNRNVTVKAYSYGYEYVADVNAPRSHSFDMIDIGGEDIGKSLNDIQERYQNYEEFFNYCSLFVLNKESKTGYGASTLVYLYFSHHTPTKTQCYTVPRDDSVKRAARDFYKKIKNKKASRKEIIKELLVQGDLKNSLDNIFKKELRAMGQGAKWYKQEPHFRFAMSAPMDFEEIIERKGTDNPIIYEAQHAKIRKHSVGYVPDIPLYIYVDSKKPQKIS